MSDSSLPAHIWNAAFAITLEARQLHIVMPWVRQMVPGVSVQDLPSCYAFQCGTIKVCLPTVHDIVCNRL